MRAINVCLILIIAMAHSSLAKKFSKCQLLAQLRHHKVPENELATWLCIAQHESGLNSAARSPRNTDGSYDNGIFQINNRYWCKDVGVGGDCHVNCAALRDDNLDDDIKCAVHIKKVQGFGAWSTLKYCKNSSALPKC
ncbi:lysozyme 1-like [Zootermopsis nevadensis]|uniref:lysozyme n=1 Tax=Zootermopsis nevadensis TaxID=136037 RepID=A0A067RC44_ZOONE|nr:lysozyme 1-like [Zootermopsis nevadensis]KDR21456.1 Lysozyme P [Zootermopsis nevadensis]